MVLGEPTVRDPQHRRELTVDSANAYSVLYNLFRGPAASDTWYEPSDSNGSDEVDAVRQRVSADKEYPDPWNKFVGSLDSQ